MKLDSNLAWQSAHAAIKGNRDVLLALAGVFFLLPTLAFALLYPQPATPAGMTPEQAWNLLATFYRESFVFMLPVLLLQMIGAMAILTLFTDRARPTVSSAIGAGVVDAVVFLAAMLLFWVGSSVAVGLVIGLAAVTGLAPVATVAVAIGIAGMLYCGLRLLLVMPVIAVEGQRNPVAALRRSWALTRGNAGRIFVLMLLLILVYMVATTLVTALAGILFALLMGVKGGQIAVAVLTSALGAVFTLYIIAMLAMVHRQLAGDTPEAIGAAFD